MEVCLNVELYKATNEIDVSITLFKPPKVAIERMNKVLDVTCGLVCSVNGTEYLDVYPTIIWLSPDMLANADFEIRSNVSWNIN